MPQTTDVRARAVVVTTDYYLAAAAPVAEPTIMLDGESSGPAASTVVLKELA